MISHLSQVRCLDNSSQVLLSLLRYRHAVAPTDIQKVNHSFNNSFSELRFVKRKISFSAVVLRALKLPLVCSLDCSHCYKIEPGVMAGIIATDVVLTVLIVVFVYYLASRRREKKEKGINMIVNIIQMLFSGIVLYRTIGINSLKQLCYCFILICFSNSRQGLYKHA